MLVDEVLRFLAQQVAAKLGNEGQAVDVSARFTALGIDSVRATALMRELSQKFSIPLPVTMAWEHPTIALLAQAVVARLAPATVAAAPNVAAPLSPPQRTDASEPIAVVGMACRFPEAASVDGYWALLRGGVDAIREVPADRYNINEWYDADVRTPGTMSTRFGGFLPRIDLFDAGHFGISPREARQMDPQQRMMLMLACEALEDAGIKTDSLVGSPTGVYFGVIWNDYLALQHRAGRDSIDAYSATGSHYSIVANRVSYALGLQGPSLAVDTACSSSLVAIHLACAALRAGDTSLALAGGVNLIVSPDSTVAMSKFGAMAPDGRSKAFDARANGYVRGEGAGVVALKRLSDALRDGNPIMCVIRGTAVNNDGASNGMTAPNPQAQEAVLAAAYASARIDTRRVRYVEAHGTGTNLGDPIEASALGKVVGRARPNDEHCFVGSVKTNFGHLEAAAGIAGFIKAALVVKNRQIPPSLHFQTPNPHIDFDGLHLRVPTQNVAWPCEDAAVAGVSSFGFGGTNCHIVVEEWRDERYSLHLGTGATAADAWQQAAQHLEQQPTTAMGAVRAFAVANQDQTLTALELAQRHSEGAVDVGVGTPTSTPRVALVFPGQGAQYVGMGQALYRHEPAFRRAFLAADEAVCLAGGRSPKSVVFSRDAEALRIVDVIQPTLFALQVAHARLWLARGLVPHVVIGHSMGEVAAAHIAGGLSLNDAARVIVARSQLVRAQHSGSGAMALVERSTEALLPLLPADAAALCIAAQNGPNTSVVAGTPQAVDALVAKLTADGHFAQRVDVDYASHHPSMDALAPPLQQALQHIVPMQMQLRMVSTVTNDALSGPECGANYWVQNIRKPVRFLDATVRALDEGVSLFVEMGPHPTLARSIQATAAMRQGSLPSGHAVTTLASAQRDEAQHRVFLSALGAAFARGAVMPKAADARPSLLVLSAKSAPALRQTATAYLKADALWRRPVEDVASSLATQRALHDVRAAAVACNVDEATAALRAIEAGQADGRVALGRRAASPPRCVFVYAGQGGQWWKMGRALQQESAFRETLESVDAELSPLCEWSILEQFNAAEIDSRVLETDVGQPLSFALQVALTAQLRAWGIVPDAIVGHSLGEVAAAHAASVLTLSEACRVVRHRSRLMRRVSGQGATAQVELGYNAALDAIRGLESRMAVAGQNSPTTCVLSGEPAAIDELIELLKVKGIFAKRLRVDVAFHSPQMDALKGELMRSLSTLRPQRATVPLFSTVTAKRVEGTELDAAYWARNLREPFLFAGATETLLSEGYDTFVEVGAHPVLLPSLRETAKAKGKPVTVVCTQKRDVDAQAAALWCVAELLAAGVDVDLAAVNDKGDAHAPLPTSPWQLERHWIVESQGASEQVVLGGHAIIGKDKPSVFPPHLAERLPEHVVQLYRWERPLSRESHKYVADHVILNTVVVPGVAYLEAVCSAAMRVLDGGVTLSDVKFERAMFLPDDEARIVEVSIAMTNGDGGRFFLSSKRRGEVDFTVHASGDLARATPRDLPAAPVLPMETSRARSHYERMRQNGLELGPAFHNIRALGVADGLAVGDIVLSEALKAEAQRYLVHPAFLDACLQVAYAALPQEVHAATDGDPMLPVSIRRFTMWRTTTFPHNATSTQRLIHRTEGRYSLDWTVADERGALLHADGFTFAQMTRAKAGEPQVLSTVWQPTPTPNSTRSLRSLLVCDADASASAWQQAEASSLTVVDATQALVQLESCSDTDVVLVSRTGDARQAYFLAQLCQAASKQRGVVVHLVTLGAFCVDGVGGAQTQALHGAMRAVAIETPQIAGWRIDVDAREPGHLAKTVLRVLMSEELRAEACVAVRGDAFFVERLAARGAVTSARQRCAPDATYLVTGGLSGVGGVAARLLVEDGARRLIVLARTPLPDRRQWKQGKHDPATRARIEAMQTLEQMGATVLYADVDVADRDAVSRAVERARGLLPPIRGVVHAAGAVAPQLLPALTQRSVDAVFAGKVDGLLAVLAATSGEPLDFVHTFSSAIGTLGLQGQFAYAAANAALDGIAASQRALGVPVTSFGFGAFAEVGMAAQRPDEARYLALAGLPAMEPRAALRRMAGVSLAAEAHALVAAIDGRALQSHFADSRTASVIAGLAPTPVAADRTQASREPLAELATVPTDGRVAWLTTYLQQQIARVLRYDAAQLDINARLNSVGLDSIMAAEVRNRIELELRARIPMVTLLQGPTTIELATQVLALVTDKIGLALESAVGGGSEHATAAEEHHALVPAPHARNEAFALTDIQHAYWFGRQGLLDLANIPTHVYVELDGQLDPERLDRAWTRMIERHDMLRAVFLQNGMQQVLKEVPEYHIDVVDLRQKPPVLAEAEIARARQRMAGSAPPLEAWPHFEIRLHLLPGGKTRLHFNVDMLIVDAFSVALIFKAWRELYENPERARSPLEVTFRDYVLAEAGIAKSSVFEKSKAYWMKRLPQLPGPPALPQAPNPDVQKIKQPVFTHRFGKVDAPTWATLKSKAGQKGLTPASLLGSGLAETVARFSKQKQFAINVTLFKRLPLHPQVNDVIGDFTSTTLLGVDWAKDATFEDRARRLTAQLWEDMDHPHMSGVSVLRELSKHTGSPVIQPVIFTCALGDFGQAVDWAGDLVYHATETSQVTLDNRIQEYRGELLVSWDTLEEQYPDHLLDDMHGSYVELLYRLATSEQAWSGQSRYALPAAQQATREAINATQAPVPDGLLHTPLHRHHEERGDAPAVIAHDRTLTHRELQQHAWGLGAALRDAGALPNRLIAVVTEPGWQRPLAALAVIESGAAYLPIDPALPADRIAFLLENAEVTHVVTTAEVKQRLVFPEHVRLWIVDSPDAPRANTPPPPVAVPTDLAYVIFTSGSTGVPKGVMVDHRGALNTCVDVNTRFGVSPSDRALALANLSFDLSVYDIFGVLAAGGALVYPAPHATRDPGAWLDLVDTHKVTLWNSVPMLLSMLVAHTQEADAQRLASLRVCMLSGDWVPLELPDQVRRLIKNVRLISMGGATEASIWSIIYEIKNINKDWRSIPYGVPMVNQSFYVLDAMLEPCPNWVTGDLYIGGIGLARGYWKDQAKTEASFIVHPHTGERLYRTGDLGRYFPDGNIEFLGRQDAQVKLQGHRVELGEIEAVMRQYPKAEDAFVLLRQHRASIPGYAESVAQNTVIPRFSKKAAGGQNAFLIGYVVCPKDVDVSEEDVRAFLRSKLPEYMVPARVIVIHEIPLGSNGKVDRRALPNPDRFEPEVQVQVTAPASETEHLLLRVWGEVLGLPPERLSVTDSFFDLGGNSLLLVEVATRLRQAKGVEVKIADLFRLPTVRQLGEHLSADADGKGDDGADKARSRADKMRRLQKRD